MESKQEVVFQGTGASGGVVTGPVFRWETAPAVVPERCVPPEETAAELQRLEMAFTQAKLQVERVQSRMENAQDRDSAQIFEAQLQVLEDPVFLEEIIEAVTSRGINAEKALYDVSEKYAQTLLRMEDRYLSERCVDIRDVTRRLLNLLAGGIAPSALPQTPHILFAREFSPSELASIDRRNLLGLVTSEGSSTSHTSIMARAIGIPAVTGLHAPAAAITRGPVEALLDGGRGWLILHPTAKRKAAYARLQETRHRFHERLQDLREAPAVTLDGESVMLSANIESPADVDAVLASGAHGVGLFRSEYLFLGSESLPDEECQFAAYSEVARRLAPAPVIIRTLDLGGDKLSASLRLPKETNPALGCRALRLCLNQPDLFKTQLRAILRASIFNPSLKIMYPMVNGVEDLQPAHALLDEAQAELQARQQPFRSDIEIGVMIEIPSAALSAEWIAPHVRFFSMGTNDLVQYTMAADRNNARVAHLYAQTHPAILNLVRRTVEAGRQAGIWTGVCGEMAWNPALVPLLLGLGVRELSMAPAVVPVAKNVIRSLRLADAEALAVEVSRLASAAEIMKRCRFFVGERVPEVFEWNGP